jgi:NAD(P)-dependent dehydrogenase (short-subunit alcohol dehydrogenase family)
MTDKRPLEGKIALVTGATRGVGRELAFALAGAGADIAVLGRNFAEAEMTTSALAGFGRRAYAVSADVRDQDRMEGVAQEVARMLGPIDILICAAGISSQKHPIWLSDTAEFHTCFDTNVLGALLAMRAVLPQMIDRRTGRIVAIGGSYGHKGVAGFGVYSASKWALRGLVKAAALDAAPFGVTVNTIAPGGIDGENLRERFRKSAASSGETEEAVLRRFTASSALGRLVEPADIAAAMLHLVGETGRMITGQDIIVDAGTFI